MTNLYKKSFADLETGLNRMQRLGELIDFLMIEDMVRVVADHQGRHFVVNETVGELMKFVAAEASEQATKLNEQWLAAHNAQCRDERGKA